MTFSYPSGAKKFRKGFEKDEEGGRRFWWDPPGKAGQLPYLPPDFVPAERIILVEGESDTMAVWQALKAAGLLGKVAVVGLSGTGSWRAAIRGIDKNGAVIGPDRMNDIFGPAKRVFVVFDRDDPYENPDGAASVERAWQEVRGDLGRKARRVILPQGINDVAEFFQRYDWNAFQVLLRKAAEPKRNYPRLDLTKPVPDTDWLVEDLFVRSEATALVADGGVGKSWITMALALAVAGGDDKFLGLPVKRHGRVLYVDEENSADLVLQRLNALGMSDKHRQNLDYIWYGGVDLLNEPEKLLEEAVELEPELVVLDSLSRVTLGAEENSNTDMTKLLRGGVVPIARETGAAVVVVHHTDASGTRTRGATSIRNAADQVVSVVKAKNERGQETGSLNIFPSKPRRKGRQIQARIEGDMEVDGYVRVEGTPEEDTPF